MRLSFRLFQQYRPKANIACAMQNVSFMSDFDSTSIMWTRIVNVHPGQCCVAAPTIRNVDVTYLKVCCILARLPKFHAFRESETTVASRLSNFGCIVGGLRSGGRRQGGSTFRDLAAAFWIVIFCTSCLDPVVAQQATPASAIVTDGDAAVTGFSGAQFPATIPLGVDPSDKTYIDLAGPSVRVIDLGAMGASAQAQLVQATKPFTVTAAQVGQVFAVVLDNADPPNIYVAATSAYGLPIVVPDKDGDGQPDRVKQGAPKASFMPGLFGPPDQGGGPGSIWRIDGVTGEVRLFADVTLDGVPNSGPALGGIAFDPASNSLFVADRDTGMIHRFDLTGKELGHYDHGVQGRTAAGLPPVPFNPSNRLDITNPQFQTANPATWAYAAPQRRIFGLAAHAGRLYYAVAEGLQIWSVAIAPDGSFGTDPRIEVTVPSGASASEISKIAFDDQGRMLLAERVAPTGAFDFGALTAAGGGRVLRYTQATSAQGPSWQLPADEYATGFSSQGNGGDGGVAVGYGYDASGALDHSACGGFIWTTGEQLRVSADAALAGVLARGGPAGVNGLQGSGIDLVRPANTPQQSYFVDYDDRFEDLNARGHLGDVAVFRACAPAKIAEGPPAPGAPPEEGAPPSEPGVPVEPVPPPGGGFGLGGLITILWPDWPPPPPPVCPVGTHPESKGVQCCPTFMIPGVDGVCQSPCANGSVVPADMLACFDGFDPADPPHVGGQGTCWDGSPAVPVAGCPGANPPLWTPTCNKCPKPPLKRCPSGYNEVAGAVPPWPLGGGWEWSNVHCVPITPGGCVPGQQKNMNGDCEPLCPGGQLAYPVNRCCVNGTQVDALGQCPGVIVPPDWYLDFLATGTGPCLLPSGNCSYYEFTITGRQRFGRGSLKLRITLPPESSFPETRVIRGSKYCSASAWSCSKSGDGFTCSAEDCGLAPGDQVVLRTEGRVAPNLTAPPPATIEKTACGLLEWQPASGPGPAVIDKRLRATGKKARAPPRQSVAGVGTDQFGRTTSKKACWTIRVVGKPAASACPPNYVATPNGQCCIAGQVTTSGQCCPRGQIPDARRQTCVPVTPPRPECVRGYTLLSSGQCCLSSQVAGDRCCPVGQIPDARRRACVAVGGVTPGQPCPRGQINASGRCCPPGQRPEGSGCITITAPPPRCPGGVRPDRHGKCPPVRERPRCSGAEYWDGIRCVPPHRICPAGTRLIRGKCVRETGGSILRTCPAGTRLIRGKCVRETGGSIIRTCPAGTRLIRGKCVRETGGSILRTCPAGTRLIRGKCVR
jgi:hypothetical protein